MTWTGTLEAGGLCSTVASLCGVYVAYVISLLQTSLSSVVQAACCKHELDQVYDMC